MRRGTLYVVATPLGHLGDLTARAAELLRAVPVVAAEDTRRSRTLLTHLGASRPRLMSFHAHSGAGAAAGILRVLAEGDDVALVTDAGTPGISAPGADLVAQVRAAGFSVVPLPGASAVTTALSAAGLPADRYLFLGFLPRKGAERARLLARAGTEEWTTVLFESPGRLGALLADLVEVAGPGRRAVVARELTKLHEEVSAGTLAELADRYAGDPAAVRGECTVVLEGTPPSTEPANGDKAGPAAERLLAAGISRKEIAKLLSEWFGLSRNDAYEVAMRGER